MVNVLLIVRGIEPIDIQHRPGAGLDAHRQQRRQCRIAARNDSGPWMLAQRGDDVGNALARRCAIVGFEVIDLRGRFLVKLSELHHEAAHSISLQLGFELRIRLREEHSSRTRKFVTPIRNLC